MKLSMPQLDLPSECSTVADDEICSQVWSLLASLYPRNDLTERRRETRYPFPCLIHLTPVLDDDTPVGETEVVIGRHLSEHGLGFYHRQPLPFRRAIASVEVEPHRWYGFLIDLNWCRFTKDGWYLSGGQFIRAASPPQAED